LDIERAIALLGVACFVAASVLSGGLLLGSKPRGERASLALLGAGTAALAAALAARWLRAAAIPVFGWFEAMTCYAVALSGAYLLLALRGRARGVCSLLIPVATVFAFCGAAARGAAPGSHVPVQGLWLVLHVATAFAAYGVFTLASVVAAAYLIQDGNLKRKRLGTVWERLPSLEALDQSMKRLVGVAFLLMTCSILLGVALVRASGGDDAWLTDPKVAATIGSWIMLAALVHLRASSDRHGRSVALLAVFGLVGLLFTFFGVHLVSDSVHDFLELGRGAGAP